MNGTPQIQSYAHVGDRDLPDDRLRRGEAPVPQRHWEGEGPRPAV